MPAARPVRAPRRAVAALASLLVVVTLAGCGTPEPTASSEPRVTPEGGWTTRGVAGLDVRVHLPGTAPTLGRGRALMIGLHGCGQTGRELAATGSWVATADAHGMVVALPTVPDGGVLAGCWDYYGPDHSRTAPARHDDDLLALTRALVADPRYDVDPDQVYVAGVSSGAGEAMVLGCLAPDLFAGVGLAAGPTIGTTATQTREVATDAATARRLCASLAGRHRGAFATQLTSVVHGADDRLAAPGYATVSAETMAGLYGATSTAAIDPADLPGGRPDDDGTVYSDARGPRVSLVTVDGLGHAWPAGAPPGGPFVSATGLDYPAYLTDFLFAHNRRVR
ncbi:hypothetical protein GCM10023340_22550 [Nocardioides marinquilinus]|uniref:PHB depolymerase family esterase n=1 Tax=Nocardioides marinquilinus TaxID=1210400 RepID=A0ABP9PLF8_9ACTN